MSDLRTQLQATLGDAYRLERELGGGGMSRVFLARDNALGRDVVIKVLSPELSASLSTERFTREIKLAAALQEPHIVPVLAAGMTSEGLPYYTMPFVRGDSLRARMLAGPVPLSDALGILRNMAQALAYAHERGIVHRDIKPENVLLSSGTAVVTDFGIAKALSASRTMDGTPPRDTSGTLTQVGSSIGTPAYMAPEQAVGDSVDARADLYAWGVVAYELLSGTHPFAGKTGTSQLIAAHIAETPRTLADVAPSVPREVSALVMQCLAKVPSERPTDANAILARLSTITTPSLAPTSSSSPFPPFSPRFPFYAVAVSVAAVALVGAGIWFTRRTPPSAPAIGAATNGAIADTSALSSLAVLPFVNTSGDSKDEYFSDGLTDELAHALSKLPGLRLAGRSSSFSFKGKSILAPEVGKALNVGAIVEGTVRRAGDRIRLTAQLTSTRDGKLLWTDAFERSGADVFAVQDAFTTAIVGALAPRLGGAPSAPTLGAATRDVSARGTNDTAAYDLYLKGRFYWAQRGAGPLDTAVMFLTAAVQRDSSFARGWAGLALAHTLHPNFNVKVDFAAASERAERAARHALLLDSTLADAHSALGFLLLRRFAFVDAGNAFTAARLFEPQNAVAAHWSAIFYNAIGDTIQSDRQMDVALSLDPLSATTVNSQAGRLYERRRFNDALDRYAQIAAISKNFPANDYLALVWAGQADSAYRWSNRVLATRSGQRALIGYATLAAAASGHWTEARALRARIAVGGTGVVSYDRALAEVAFGNTEAAAEAFVDNLEHDGGLANLVWSVCHPPYDAIRTEPAWKAFLARHQLKDCGLSSPWPVGKVPALR